MPSALGLVNSDNECTKRRHGSALCYYRNTHRMAAGPLFIVVDEYVVPGEGAHVEGLEGAEDPEEWKEEKSNWRKTGGCVLNIL